MIEHKKVEQKYSNSMILIFLHLENKFTIHWRFSNKLDAQCIKWFNIQREPIICTLTFRQYFSNQKENGGPKKYKQLGLMYVGKSLTPIELGLNLEAKF